MRSSIQKLDSAFEASLKDFEKRCAKRLEALNSPVKIDPIVKEDDRARAGTRSPSSKSPINPREPTGVPPGLEAVSGGIDESSSALGLTRRRGRTSPRIVSVSRSTSPQQQPPPGKLVPEDPLGVWTTAPPQSSSSANRHHAQEATRHHSQEATPSHAQTRLLPEAMQSESQVEVAAAAAAAAAGLTSSRGISDVYLEQVLDELEALRGQVSHERIVPKSLSP